MYDLTRRASAAQGAALMKCYCGQNNTFTCIMFMQMLILILTITCSSLIHETLNMINAPISY